MRLIYSGPGNQTIQLTESPTEDTCYCAKATNPCGSNTADACVIVDQPPDCICDDEVDSLPEKVKISGFNSSDFFGCTGGPGPMDGFFPWNGEMMATNHNVHGFPCRGIWQDVGSSLAGTFTVDSGLRLDNATLTCDAGGICDPQETCWTLAITFPGSTVLFFWIGRKLGGSSPTGTYTRIDSGYDFGTGCLGPAEIEIE